MYCERNICNLQHIKRPYHDQSEPKKHRSRFNNSEIERSSETQSGTMAKKIVISSCSYRFAVSISRERDVPPQQCAAKQQFGSNDSEQRNVNWRRCPNDFGVLGSMHGMTVPSHAV